jgi:hypothetical protein
LPEPPRHRRPWTVAESEQVWQLNQTHDAAEIAEMLGRSEGAVLRVLLGPPDDEETLRRRLKRYAGECMLCFAPTSGARGPRAAATVCRACRNEPTAEADIFAQVGRLRTVLGRLPNEGDWARWLFCPASAERRQVVGGRVRFAPTPKAIKRRFKMSFAEFTAHALTELARRGHPLGVDAPAAPERVVELDLVAPVPVPPGNWPKQRELRRELCLFCDQQSRRSPADGLPAVCDHCATHLHEEMTDAVIWGIADAWRDKLGRLPTAPQINATPGLPRTQSLIDARYADPSLLTAEPGEALSAEALRVAQTGNVWLYQPTWAHLLDRVYWQKFGGPYEPLRVQHAAAIAAGARATTA